MTLLYKTLFAWKCTSTHHKLALDALRQLRGDDAENWRNLFLSKIEWYLDGSKAPDNKFKDFKNHVLHVKDNYWGGAVSAVEKWYKLTVDALIAQNWNEVVYNAGVLSHYYTDPIMPFHTGQTEEEGIVHRAAEWSIAKSYEELQSLLEQKLGGYPSVETPEGTDWLKQMVHRGADLANPHYEPLIDHYNLELGVKDPPAGLDSECKERLAPLLGHAAVGFARIFERAVAEAGAKPPATTVTMLGILAGLTVPIFWVTKNLKDSRDRAAVTAIWEEFQKTGKVVQALPPDDKEVRKLHAEEVLKVPLATLDAQKPRPTGTKHAAGGMISVPTSPSSVPENPAPPIERVVEKPEPAPTLEKKEPATTVKPVPAPTLEKKEPAKMEKPVSAAPQAEKKEPAKTEKPGLVIRVEKKEPTGTQKAEPVKETKAASTPPQPERAAPLKLHEPPPIPAPNRTPKFYLTPDMPVEAAPSIGPKTAEKLATIGVKTVADLMAKHPESAAQQLNVKYIDAEKFRDWQAQANLVCRIPGIRGHDAQILVGCGIDAPEHLHDMPATDLVALVEEFAGSPDGERLFRTCKKPDLAEVTQWIAWAKGPEVKAAA